MISIDHTDLAIKLSGFDFLCHEIVDDKVVILYRQAVSPLFIRYFLVCLVYRNCSQFFHEATSSLF